MSTQITIQGHNLIKYDELEEPLIRDVELGCWANLAKPTDIRRTIKKAIEAGDLQVVSNIARMRALFGVGQVLEIVEQIERGNGAVRPATVYELDREACLHVLLLLRTAEAIRVKREMIAVYAEYTRAGRVGSNDPTLLAILERMDERIARLEDAAPALRAAPQTSFRAVNATSYWQDFTARLEATARVWAQAKRITRKNGKPGNATGAIRSKVKGRLDLHHITDLTVEQWPAAMVYLNELRSEAEALLREESAHAGDLRWMEEMTRNEVPS